MRPASPFADSMVLQAQQMLNKQQSPMSDGTSGRISLDPFMTSQLGKSGGSGIAQFGQATPFSAPPGSPMPDMNEQFGQASPIPISSRTVSAMPHLTGQKQSIEDVMSRFKPVMANLEASQPLSQGPASQGIGGLFSQQMGTQGNQPLMQYGEYLNKTYAMPQIETERQKISEFLDMVNRAEQAHFANLA